MQCSYRAVTLVDRYMPDCLYLAGRSERHMSSHEPPIHGARTVLIVEDQPVIRALLCIALEAEDYQVTTAEDGEDALRQVHHQQPDAILLDLMLPKMDGWAVIDSLDRDNRAIPIPIIVVSASYGSDLVGGRNVKAFLSKPYDLDALMLTLEETLSPSRV
jgi:CheY-like chemotaxis protein